MLSAVVGSLMGTDKYLSDEYTYYLMSDLVRIVGTYAYRYDENGNLLEKGDVYVESGEEVSIEQSGDYTLFEYDLLNRLVSANKIDEDTGALRQVVSYRYNHKNLRIERTDDEGTTRYVFDLAGNIIEEHDAEGLTRYVFRNNKHLAKITPDGKTYYYGTDNLGSTTVLFDEDGNVVWKGEISAFGDVVLGQWIGEALFNERVKFTGKDYDEVTGLYYFNARWYDPELGRFTSEDPIRDGINWHVYTYNNPLKYIDPTGLMGDAAALAAAEAKRNIPNSDSKEKWTRPNDDKDDKGHKIDKSTSNHGVDQWVNRNMVLQNANTIYLISYNRDDMTFSWTVNGVTKRISLDDALAGKIPGFIPGKDRNFFQQNATEIWPTAVMIQYFAKGLPYTTRSGEFQDERGRRWKRDFADVLTDDPIIGALIKSIPKLDKLMNHHNNDNTTGFRG